MKSAIIQDATISAEVGAGLQPKMAWLLTGTAAAATTSTTRWDATTTVSRSALAFTAQSAVRQSTVIRCPRACIGVQVRVAY